MAIQVGDLIEIQHYNELALEINRLFSDNTVSLGYTTSNIIMVETFAGGASAGTTRNLSPSPAPGDFLVVSLGNNTIQQDVDYTITYTNPATITFIDPIDSGVTITVFNRESHRYGWGQQASVYPITTGELIRADEAVLQAYLEANLNNVIDKVNIMEDRTGGPTELTRLAQGNLIRAVDKLTIQNTINNDILDGSYWNNDIATLTNNVLTYSRSDPWTTELTATTRYTWDSYDDMRYFLNSGSQLRMSFTAAGDTSIPGFNNWSQVINAMGSLIMNYDTASQTLFGGISANRGVYEMVSEYQDIFVSGSPSLPVDNEGNSDAYGTYSDLVIVWAARILENTPAAGQISVDIRATFDDRLFNQTFVGTLTCQAGYLAADDIVDNSATFSINAFKPTITTDLGAGETGFVVSGESPPVSPTNEFLSWSGQGANGTDVSAGFTQDTGIMSVIVKPELLGNAPLVTLDTTTTIYVLGGEDFSTTSSLRLQGNGGPGDTSSVEIRFSPDSVTPYDNAVSDLSFRISDIDWASANHKEKITLRAYNTANELIPIIVTTGTNIAVSSPEANVFDIIPSVIADVTPANPAGSALIEVGGPVARVELVYRNDLTLTHAAWISDIYFTTIPL